MAATITTTTSPPVETKSKPYVVLNRHDLNNSGFETYIQERIELYETYKKSIHEGTVKKFALCVIHPCDASTIDKASYYKQIWKSVIQEREDMKMEIRSDEKLSEADHKWQFELLRELKMNWARTNDYSVGDYGKVMMAIWDVKKGDKIVGVKYNPAFPLPPSCLKYYDGDPYLLEVSSDPDLIIPHLDAGIVTCKATLEAWKVHPEGWLCKQKAQEEQKQYQLRLWLNTWKQLVMLCEKKDTICVTLLVDAPPENQFTRGTVCIPPSSGGVDIKPNERDLYATKVMKAITSAIAKMELDIECNEVDSVELKMKKLELMKRLHGLLSHRTRVPDNGLVLSVFFKDEDKSQDDFFLHIPETIMQAHGASSWKKYTNWSLNMTSLYDSGILPFVKVQMAKIEAFLTPVDTTPPKVDSST